MKINYPKEFLSLIILLLIPTLFLYTPNAILLITSLPNIENYIIYYLFLFPLFFWLSKRYNNKITSTIFIIIGSPILIFYYSFIIGFPFIILFFHLLFYFFISIFIPFIFQILYEQGLFTFLNKQLTTYIVITSIVMIAVIFQKQIKCIVHRISPARLWSSKKLRIYNIEELSNYLLSESNIKFVVFSLYLVLIISINCYNFKDIGFFSDVQIDKAVLQSFATYLALDRVISNLKQLEFKPSEMLNKIRNSVSNKLNEDERKTPE